MKDQVTPICTVTKCVEGVRIWYTPNLLHLHSERISKNRKQCGVVGPWPQLDDQGTPAMPFP